MLKEEGCLSKPWLARVLGLVRKKVLLCLRYFTTLHYLLYSIVQLCVFFWLSIIQQRVLSTLPLSVAVCKNEKAEFLPHC